MIRLMKFLTMAVVLVTLVMIPMAQGEPGRLHEPYVSTTGMTIDRPSGFSVRETEPNVLQMLSTSNTGAVFTLSVGEPAVEAELDMTLLDQGAVTLLKTYAAAVVANSRGTVLSAQTPFADSVIDGATQQFDIAGSPILVAVAIVGDGVPVMAVIRDSENAVSDPGGLAEAVIASIRFAEPPPRYSVDIPAFACPAPTQPANKIVLCSGPQFDLPESLEPISGAEIRDAVVLRQGSDVFASLVTIPLGDFTTGQSYAAAVLGTIARNGGPAAINSDPLSFYEIIDSQLGQRTVRVFDSAEHPGIIEGDKLIYIIDLYQTTLIYMEVNISGGDRAKMRQTFDQLALSTTFRPEVTVTAIEQAQIANIYAGDLACNSSSLTLTFPANEPRSLVVTCPANCTAGIVWGTDLYTSDSSVCTAAVHAGLITLAEGGQFIITYASGKEGYDGSERNGVTTLNFGRWGDSFTLAPLD
jgi:hypothetical protein